MAKITKINLGGTEYDVGTDTTYSAGSGITMNGTQISVNGAPCVWSRGNVTAETGASLPAVTGMSMAQVYNNGYPIPYGNIITLYGTGCGQILVGWSGTNGGRASVYVRSKRDVQSAEWSQWYELKDSGNLTVVSKTAAGLCPALPNEDTTTKYLRQDGTWVVPPNTTYSAATQSAAGLMSADDKKKLDGIESGAEANTVTGVKGNGESTYRTGNVNITKANVELGNVANALQVYDKASVSGNMNQAAGFRNAIGMISLSGTDAKINPNGQTSWHHFINMSYAEQSGSNMWQTQIAVKAGTTDPWIRSRAGGAIVDGTAWMADWVRILTGSNWSNVITKTALGIGNVENLAQGKAIKSITRSGTTFTYTCLDGTTGTFTQQDNNTTYSAGAGLALSGTTFKTSVPRVAKSCNSYPAKNTFIVEEYTAGTNYNLPSNTWYHIITISGDAEGHGTQLALGLTTNAAYYRTSVTGGTWLSLINTDTNTWRGIQDNLTSSTNTTESLSAKQGYLLANGSARDNTKLPLSGGTMTGQLKTSFKSSVAIGSMVSNQATIPNLCDELRYSSGVCGSFNLSTAYKLNNIKIGTGWYNFMWIPHRSGGVNGAASGDNCSYGSLILSGMTVSGCYVIRYANGISELRNLYANDNTWKANSASSEGYVASGSGQANKVWKTDADGNPAWRDDNATDSTKVAKTGDTMSGTLKNTYNAQTWVNGLTNAALTMSNTTGYNSLICCPTKNGNISFSVHTNADDIVRLGYGERGRTDNSFVRQINWNAANGNLSVDMINGVTVGSSPKFTDTLYNFAGATFNSGDRYTAGHDCDTCIQNGVYYYTSHGPAKSLGATTDDGALFVQRYSDIWVVQIASDYRNGSLFVRSKNNGTWMAWRKADTTDLGSMTGTLPVSKGGTGATTRLGALQNLTSENVGTSSQYFLTITTNWAKGGYCSVNDAKTVLGLGNKADLASPTFTGTPKAPTAASGTNSTQIATTEFVNKATSEFFAKSLGRAVLLSGGVLTQASGQQIWQRSQAVVMLTDGTKITVIPQNCNSQDIDIYKKSDGTQYIWYNGSLSGYSKFLDYDALIKTDGSSQSVITVDAALSSTSTNPVQNKVINSALAGKQDTLGVVTDSDSTTYFNWKAIKVGRVATVTVGGQSGITPVLPEAFKPAHTVYGASNTTIGIDGKVTCKGVMTTITYITAS